MTGRLTHPLRYDASTDRYVEITSERAFTEIGDALKRFEPDGTVFYASGHAGLDASYLYALLARKLGTNNLPQSSNMCHETTSCRHAVMSLQFWEFANVWSRLTIKRQRLARRR